MREYRVGKFAVVPVAATAGFLLSAAMVAAGVTGSLLPTADGFYTQWTPSTGTSHFALVDESVCNGVTDYNSTTVAGNRDSYSVSLSSVPNGSQITQIELKPCASRASGGGASPVMNVFYRLNGVNSADSGAYSLSGTTPAELATTTFAGLGVIKSSSTALEAGAVLTSGTKGARLSRIATRITYTALNAPSSLVAGTTTSSSISLTWQDNATIEDGYTVERSTNAFNWVGIATTTANVTAYEDTGLSSGTTYYHRVRAYNAGGYSAYSNPATSTTP